MEFVRSSPAPRHDCSLGPRDQINQITSFIDGSNLYGSTAEEQHELRLMEKGKNAIANDESILKVTLSRKVEIHRPTHTQASSTSTQSRTGS